MVIVKERIANFQLPKFSWKSLNKDEKGLTLIELLAVIVILAIIAAIAIPSIGGIINKTKKESHRANAQIIIDGARFKVTAEDFKPDTQGGSTQTITLKDINDSGFLEKVPKDPQGSNPYNADQTVVTVTQSADGKLSYAITLVGEKGTYFNNVKEEDLKTATIGP